MVLDTENREFPVFQAFHRIIVQVQVCDLKCITDRIRIDRIAVVLGRNMNSAVRQVADRVITTAVTEFKLERFRAEGTTSPPPILVMNFPHDFYKHMNGGPALLPLTF